jgi:hypothetical protein
MDLLVERWANDEVLLQMRRRRLSAHRLHVKKGQLVGGSCWSAMT